MSAALVAGFVLASLPGDVPGLVSGSGFAYAAAKTYPPSHYRPPRCAWVTERYWHKGRWHWRRVWRCW